MNLQAESNINLEGTSFAFKDSDFLVIKRLIHENTGIYLDHTKRFLVQTRLSRRLKILGLKNFHEYRMLLQSGNPQELEHLANAITTNTTSFFRHDNQFDFLKELFEKMNVENNFESLRIWSAGCSSGEEPYTIASTAFEVFSPENLGKIKILATDLDSEVIRRAEKAVYPTEVVSQLTEKKMKNIFLRGVGPNEGFLKIKPELRQMITFRKLNLIKSWPLKETFDIIFCRNVCIYFHKDTQRVLMERMADMQDKDGYLFIGQSENLFSTCHFYKMLEPAIYQKIY